ncbi:MAG: adenylosuccinate synthase [Thermoplasmata archaeon]|nr:adenylosuccinate synthase [Thermoplasmata archaeon]
MPVTVVVGAQFGDEGKGKITDWLASRFRYVVRTGGGPNTGHTVHLAAGTAVLHQVSCGVLRPGVLGISGPGMVIDPFGYETELADLRNRHLLHGEPVLSERAHVLLPLHEIEDGWEESVRQGGSSSAGLGTTRRGIGPVYADRYGRWGLRIADLLRHEILASRLDLLYRKKAHLPGLPPIAELRSRLAEVGSRLAPYVRATEPILWGAIERSEPILLEGAQSVLLDIDFGTYPYVTSSHPTSAGALMGSGIPPQELDESVGVAKAYATRVGAGPFPTEVEGEMGEYLRKAGSERGATTGRPRRCGWLDLVMLRYATRLNGFTSLAITKVDVLGGLDEIPVCTQYVTPAGETLTDYPPPVAEDLAKVMPAYERFPSWPKFTERLKERLRREGAKALPAELRRFLTYLHEQTRVPVEFVSFGSAREDTLWMGRGAPSRMTDAVAPWSG